MKILTIRPRITQKRSIVNKIIFPTKDKLSTLNLKEHNHNYIKHKRISIHITQSIFHDVNRASLRRVADKEIALFYSLNKVAYRLYFLPKTGATIVYDIFNRSAK